MTINHNQKQKLHLIARNCQEILTEKDLENLLVSNTPLNHYIGLEISGLVHLGTGLICMGKIADFLKAGATCQIFLADFHSYLNHKLDGNWKLIREMTQTYFQEALIASLACFGVGEGKLKFVLGKNLYRENPVHWETFMEVGQHITLSRGLRSISIMGKEAGNDVNLATLFYPPLQVADIFTMQVNLAHAGLDQRKAHVIARQVAKKLTINPLKNKQGQIITPVAVHHNLVAGLAAPTKEDLGKKQQETSEALKMSKSKPGSAIFVHDSPEEIRAKIKTAYCPPQILEHNPLINWVETLVFWGEKTGELRLSRPAKFGGPKVYRDIEKIKHDYQEGLLHPLDLKNGVGDWLIEKLAPARAHFKNPSRQKALLKMQTLTQKSKK